MILLQHRMRIGLRLGYCRPVSGGLSISNYERLLWKMQLFSCAIFAALRLTTESLVHHSGGLSRRRFDGVRRWRREEEGRDVLHPLQWERQSSRGANVRGAPVLTAQRVSGMTGRWCFFLFFPLLALLPLAYLRSRSSVRRLASRFSPQLLHAPTKPRLFAVRLSPSLSSFYFTVPGHLLLRPLSSLQALVAYMRLCLQRSVIFQLNATLACGGVPRCALPASNGKHLRLLFSPRPHKPIPEVLPCHSTSRCS